MKRALLVEDDPISSAFLSEALDVLGWQVDAFAFGEAAVAAAMAQRFDVLLLDLNLPDIDGVRLLRSVRNCDQNASADAPALALTADDRIALHQHLRRQGFDAVLAKPVSLEQLRSTVQNLMDEVPSGCPTELTAHALEDAPIWDDAAALRALGQRHETVQAMRAMMLADLPAQRQQILREPGSAASRTLLHRLRAACGFVGASRLAQAVIALEDACDPIHIHACGVQFDAAVREILDSRPRDHELPR
ncbi:MAG TPA: response regulator [Chiayiivirga sp.]|nr:response regulator [Chiayiivirga sp.]